MLQLRSFVLLGAIGAWLAVLPNSSRSQELANTGISFRGYGQLHFAFQSFDDGTTTTSNLVDITNSNSRVGFYLEGSGPVSFHFESGLGFRPSSKTSQINTPPLWNWDVTDLRIVQLVWESGIGTFEFGQGKMPTDGAAEADLGGTVVVAKSTIPEALGSYFLRDSTGALTGVTIGDTFDNLDGARRGRLRYTTPDWRGFDFTAAIGREILKQGDSTNYYELAFNYRRTFGDVKLYVVGGLAVADGEAAVTHRSLGSISFFHVPTGLNLSVAGGHGETSADYVYGKFGWNTSLVRFGTTKFIAELFSGNDYVLHSSKSNMWGVAILQEVEAIGTEVYAGYRTFSFSDPSPTEYQDASALQIGARWRF